MKPRILALLVLLLLGLMTAGADAQQLVRVKLDGWTEVRADLAHRLTLEIYTIFSPPPIRRITSRAFN